MIRKTLITASALAVLAVAQPAAAESAAQAYVANRIWVRSQISEVNANYSKQMTNYLTITGFNPIDEMSPGDLEDLFFLNLAILDMARSFDGLCDTARENWGPLIVDSTRCDRIDEDVAYLEQDRAKLSALRKDLADALAAREAEDRARASRTPEERHKALEALIEQVITPKETRTELPVGD